MKSKSFNLVAALLLIVTTDADAIVVDRDHDLIYDDVKNGMTLLLIRVLKIGPGRIYVDLQTFFLLIFARAATAAYCRVPSHRS